MCFAPQRRALFRHVNFEVLCTVWLGNVLRATTVRTFSTSQLAKVVRDRQFLTLLTWTCASLHNRVHFFDISTCKKLPAACNFLSLISPDGSAPAALASLLFDPPEPQIIGKTHRCATFLPFRAPTSSFFRGFLFSDLLSSSLLFSDSSHLCFFICPYCWKFDV